MTRAKVFDKTWRMVFKKNDFSISDEIYHPDFKGLDPIVD